MAGDLARAGVGEEELAFAVDDDDAVGGALEKVSVTLERLQPSLGFETSEGDLLRLIAQALQDARVAQSDGGGVGDSAIEGELMVSEGEHVARAQEKHAHWFVFEQDGHQ